MNPDGGTTKMKNQLYALYIEREVNASKRVLYFFLKMIVKN